MKKEEQYKALVEKRKACRICMEHGLVNPSEIENGKYDSDEIGPLTRWQGNLNADIMIVAQDWGSTREFILMEGVDRETNKTDQTLMEMLTHLGIHFKFNEKSERLYFTNAALCIREGGAQGNLNNKWLTNCRPFLKEQIDIVQPKLIIALGQMTHKAVVKALNIDVRIPTRFSETINLEPVKYQNSLIFPVYHTGSLGLRNRRKPLQIEDWKRIEKYL